MPLIAALQTQFEHVPIHRVTLSVCRSFAVLTVNTTSIGRNPNRRKTLEQANRILSSMLSTESYGLLQFFFATRRNYRRTMIGRIGGVGRTVARQAAKQIATRRTTRQWTMKRSMTIPLNNAGGC